MGYIGYNIWMDFICTMVIKFLPIDGLELYEQKCCWFFCWICYVKSSRILLLYNLQSLGAGKSKNRKYRRNRDKWRCFCFTCIRFIINIVNSSFHIWYRRSKKYQLYCCWISDFPFPKYFCVCFHRSIFSKDHRSWKLRLWYYQDVWLF